MAKHVEGIWAEKYDKGNMSREIYIALFCYCYQLLFQPRSPTFKTVNNRRAISVRMRAAAERQLQ